MKSPLDSLQTMMEAEKGPPPKIEKNMCALKWYLDNFQKIRQPSQA